MRQNGAPRALHRGRAHRGPRQLEGEIGLYAGVNVRSAARINGPSPLGELVLENVVGSLAGRLGLMLSQKSQQQNVFALEDRIPLELTHPVAILMLIVEQPA